MNGTNTARIGISSLKDIRQKFENFNEDLDSRIWLETMGYDINRIDSIKTKSDFGEKPNLFLKIKYEDQIHKEKILVKLINSLDSNNQLGKTNLDYIYEIWDIPDDIHELLEYFTGERRPYKEGRDLKRMFLTEFSDRDQKKIQDWFEDNKETISRDIFQGIKEDKPAWLLVASKSEENSLCKLVSIEAAQEFFIEQEKVSVTAWGSLDIGRVTMLRKGGNDENANMLIFRFRPGDILDRDNEQTKT